MNETERVFNGEYSGEFLNRVAFPLGGIGAGMVCLEGTGGLSQFSLRHKPEVGNAPQVFAAIRVHGESGGARVLEGPVPEWKVMYPFNGTSTGNGLGNTHFGLPRFEAASFSARFPFAQVNLQDRTVPVSVQIEGWSPFIPGDSKNSSLPVAGLEYVFRNQTDSPVAATFSFHARNFMKAGENTAQAVRKVENGFVLEQQATDEHPEYAGAFTARVLESAQVNPAWFRGGWFDALSIVWRDIENDNGADCEEYTDGDPSPGGSLFVPLHIPVGGEQRVRLLLGWRVPNSAVQVGEPGTCCSGKTTSCDSMYKPWYAVEFADMPAVMTYWTEQYESLKKRSGAFRDAFYRATLPPAVMEAIAANLTILKSPTVLRQHDGRLWCWEGCCDSSGCCAGSCTHVWNYAQALPHLFPDLERSLRQTEFNENQDARGHQNFRAWLPIRPTNHDFHAAADGQLGGIMKLHREWLISGDNKWLAHYWEKARASMAYCMEIWDPRQRGVLEEPHHNTYDIEFWGPDGMCTSFYLGALKAMMLMGAALNEDTALYETLYERGRAFMETELFNGEYFIQRVEWKNLRADNPTASGKYSPEAQQLLEQEGPKYQYGEGCLADGVLGAWMAAVCGIGEIMDQGKVKSHLLAVYKYNLKHDLSAHANPQRPSYALGREGGLLLCSWPRGGALSLPFVYSNEVWTGIEYQVASHLMLMGCTAAGLDIVRTARKRYDGRVRNPFNEYECGHWYARALSSYALIQGLTGLRYDARTRTLAVTAPGAGEFRAFLATDTGFGLVERKNGEFLLNVVEGEIPVESWDIREG